VWCFGVLPRAVARRVRFVNISLEEDLRMYTSLVLFALVGTAVPGADASRAPAWLSDYGTACRKGQTEKKPLAIFFGRGESGWGQLCNGGPLGDGATRLLQARYVPVYFDLDRDAGRRMASAFGVKGSP